MRYGAQEVLADCFRALPSASTQALWLCMSVATGNSEGDRLALGEDDG